MWSYKKRLVDSFPTHDLLATGQPCWPWHRHQTNLPPILSCLLFYHSKVRLMVIIWWHYPPENSIFSLMASFAIEPFFAFSGTILKKFCHCFSFCQFFAADAIRQQMEFWISGSFANHWKTFLITKQTPKRNWKGPNWQNFRNLFYLFEL